MRGKGKGGTHDRKIEEEKNGYIVLINTEGKTLPQSEKKGGGGHHT